MSKLGKWISLGFFLMFLAGLVWADDQGKNPAPKPDQKNAAPPSQPSTRTQTSAGGGRKTHVRLGGVVVGASYTHWSGRSFWGYPGYWGYWSGPWGWYPWWGYSPFYYPGTFYPGYFDQGYGKGTIRLSVEPRESAVFVNGAYAGNADRLRTFWLDPGAYDLEVRANGYAPYQQRVYVLSGKTLRIAAALEAEEAEVKP